MILKWYDNYKKVNFELRTWKDLWDMYYDEIQEINRSSKSEWTRLDITVFWSSPDMDDYQPSRWSDLIFNSIVDEKTN